MKLPGGEVTFCFTDVEGSTKLFGALGTAFVELVEEYRSIVSELVTKHEGVVVNTEGDGFFVVFKDPLNAAMFCAENHRELAQRDWRGRDTVRVRAGLHLGVTEPIRGDYIAYEVHEASRIAGSGHGGQTILSSAVVDRVWLRLPASLTVTDLGMHSLNDIPPQHLYELHPDDRVADTRPLRSDRVQRGSVPAPTATIIGRDAALGSLHEALVAHRLVTVVGTGGVGKTRLAIEAALAVRDDHTSSGVWFTDLASVSSDDGVVDAVLHTLGLVPDAGLPAIEQLVCALRASDALVLLDNCEHVLDAATNVANALLSRCASVRVLATSREPLKVDGERLFRLGPLTSADGVALFVARAGVAASIDADDPAIARIVEQLDGVPLAIELAAARTNVFSPSQLSERLNDRFRILNVGARSADQRQQTLEAAIDWSYNLLEPDEQRTLRSLAVIVGSFDFDVAEAIVPDVLDHLGPLIDKSMVATEVENHVTRYRLLETIRHYGLRELAASGEVEAAFGAHVSCFAHRSEVALGLMGENDAEASAAMAADEANLCAAIDRAKQHGRLDDAVHIAAHAFLYWGVAGRASRGLERMAPLLAAVGADPITPDAIQMSFGAAWLSLLAFEAPADVERLARPALDQARSRPESEAPLWYEAWAAQVIALARAAVNAFRDAELELEALDLARRSGSAYVESQAWLARATTVQGAEGFEAGDEAEAFAVVVARQGGSPSALALALATRAAHLFEAGDVDGARAALAEAVPYGRRGANVPALTEALRVVGRLKSYLGEDDASVPLLEARDLSRRTGSSVDEAYAEWFLANLAFDRNDGPAVHEHCEAAIELFMLFASRRAQCFLAASMVRGLQAAQQLREGDASSALTTLQTHVALGEFSGLDWVYAYTLNGLGYGRCFLGDLDAAEHSFHSAYRVAAEKAFVHRERQMRAAALRGLSCVAVERGDAVRAATLAGAADSVFQPGFFDLRQGWHMSREALGKTQQMLAPHEFDAAFAEGRSYGLDFLRLTEGD